MAILIRSGADRARAAAARRADPGALVIDVGPGSETPEPIASVRVRVADPALSARIVDAVRARVAAALDAPAATRPAIRIPSRATARRLAGALPGAFAVVPLSARNRRHLGEILALVTRAGAAGVQIAAAPPLAPAVARALFAALESRRGARGCPVIAAPGEAIAEVLRRLTPA